MLDILYDLHYSVINQNFTIFKGEKMINLYTTLFAFALWISLYIWDWKVGKPLTTKRYKVVFYPTLLLSTVMVLGSAAGGVAIAHYLFPIETPLENHCVLCLYQLMTIGLLTGCVGLAMSIVLQKLVLKYC
jgi:hypothetical protein